MTQAHSHTVTQSHTTAHTRWQTRKDLTYPSSRQFPAATEYHEDDCSTNARTNDRACDRTATHTVRGHSWTQRLRKHTKRSRALQNKQHNETQNNPTATINEIAHSSVFTQRHPSTCVMKLTEHTVGANGDMDCCSAAPNPLNNELPGPDSAVCSSDCTALAG